MLDQRKIPNHKHSIVCVRKFSFGKTCNKKDVIKRIVLKYIGTTNKRKTTQPSKGQANVYMFCVIPVLVDFHLFNVHLNSLYYLNIWLGTTVA